MKFLSLLNKTCNFSSDTKSFHNIKDDERYSHSEYVSVAVFQTYNDAREAMEFLPNFKQGFYQIEKDSEFYPFFIVDTTKEGKERFISFNTMMFYLKHRILFAYKDVIEILKDSVINMTEKDIQNFNIQGFAIFLNYNEYRFCYSGDSIVLSIKESEVERERNIIAFIGSKKTKRALQAELLHCLANPGNIKWINQTITKYC